MVAKRGGDVPDGLGVAVLADLCPMPPRNSRRISTGALPQRSTCRRQSNASGLRNGSAAYCPSSSALSSAWPFSRNATHAQLWTGLISR